MTARARRKAVVLLAGLVLAPRGVAADWQQFLTKPLSPGSVALLVERASEPHVRARWAEALKDSRPAVRAAAARAVNVTATVSLLPEVAAALAVETDGSAAAEEAEALAALEGRARDEDLLAAVRREVRFAPVIAMALARSRGREALGHTALITALSDEAAMPPFVRLATRRDPATLAYAGAVAIRERNTSMWSAVLGIARDADVATDEGILISSLQVAELRATTLWHLVLASPQPSARVSEALESSSEGKGQSDHAGARLAYEIVRRRLGRPAREDAGWLAALRDPGPAGAPFELGHHRAALRRLTPSELSALSERVRGDARELAKWLRAKDPKFPDRGRVRATGSDEKRPVTLRMPDEFPPGLVSDVLFKWANERLFPWYFG